jgi:hypothetical protein
MGDSSSLNKALLPHPMHVFCLESSIWNSRTKIFWKHHFPITIPVVPTREAELGRLQFKATQSKVSPRPYLKNELKQKDWECSSRGKVLG